MKWRAQSSYFKIIWISLNPQKYQKRNTYLSSNGMLSSFIIMPSDMLSWVCAGYTHSCHCLISPGHLGVLYRSPRWLNEAMCTLQFQLSIKKKQYNIIYCLKNYLLLTGLWEWEQFFKMAFKVCIVHISCMWEEKDDCSQ